MPKKHFRSQSTSASSAKSSSLSGSCHHERHLRGNALKIYNLFWRLGKKSDSVAMTNDRIARCIGAVVSERSDSITRTKTALRREGWLEFIEISKGAKSGTWGGARYRAISHEVWAEMRLAEDGISPCFPEPRQVQVSQTHPGGRRYQRQPGARTANSLEARTVDSEKQSHRACAEARTDLLPGSTHTVRARKHAHSVDFKTGERSSRKNEQLMQGALPPATPKDHHDAPIGAREGGSPPSFTPPSEKPKPKSPWEEKREAEEAEAAARDAAQAARVVAVEEAWKAIGISPESMNPQVRGLFWHFVLHKPEAAPMEHLDLTIEQCATWKLELGEDILTLIRAAKARFKAKEIQQSPILEVAS
jgi:hypothetical protein